ncbi:protocatechuate 3,4-dioxygenase subunit alpha [Microbulbifer taiwanensis]|uniref:Protocatechuate 3,4-dioxygenase subunit alpha n=1 Tax=Microbulbifer taiwanensis TaxID=986746 RepID=A0ABW1YM71_9GAMM|nr:protocatechuate 3,4-dioxygenase subunit alpha [Microbulbifer taiwanensis]
MKLKQTASQTVGPYFAYGLTPQQYGYDFRSIFSNRIDGDGERIALSGRVFDGNGEAVNDAMIEIWQADARGQYQGNGFARFGTGTDSQCRFHFDTIRPGSIDNEQAPHICVLVFMRGLLLHNYTRIYFSDEAAANERDPVLNSVPAERRGTLIAERSDTPDGPAYRFDIHMQGERETVFFDV